MGLEATACYVGGGGGPLCEPGGFVPPPRRDGGARSDAALPRDARLDAPDAFVLPPCGPATTSITARIVDEASDAPLARAAVRVEGTCGDGLEVRTGADGIARFVVDGAHTWSLTAAMVGHHAISILDVTRLEAVGDVRLEVANGPPPVVHSATGTLSGSVGAGSTVRIDGFDFVTLANAGGSWASAHYIRAGGTVPTRFAAVERDAAGEAVNIGVTSEATRPSGPLAGVTLVLPAPSEPAVETTVPIQFHFGGGSFPVVEPVSADVLYVGTHPLAPEVRIGSALFGPPPGPALVHELVVRDFAVLPGNWLVARFASADGGVLVTVCTAFVGAGTAIDVGEIYAMGWEGDGTYGGATAYGRMSGYDFVAMHLGESAAGDPPAWRVFAPSEDSTTTTLHIPHLPAGVTIADIGVAAPHEARIYALDMDPGVMPWSLPARGSTTRGHRVIAAERFVPLEPAGR